MSTPITIFGLPYEEALRVITAYKEGKMNPKGSYREGFEEGYKACDKLWQDTLKSICSNGYTQNIIYKEILKND